MKETYLTLMDKTLDAYTTAHIERYFADVRRDGLTEHGFPRLTANIGILIAHGRRRALMPLFLDMMDFCCAAIPQVKAANEFSVKEIISCIMALEESGAVDAGRIAGWKAALATIDPFACYSKIAYTPEDKVHNWACFALVSEWMRQYIGLCDATAFLNVQLPTQLRRMDSNGMYRDPHDPMVYDLVPRGLFAVLLHFGYRGEYYAAIDDNLRKAGLLTLDMLSVTGEIPYGGRSAQFLYNEAMLSVVLEYEARRYAAEGDLALAGRFKRAVQRALENLTFWLAQTPIRHIKNDFPTESKYGCEGYAYFDKYMITVASFLYAACLVCDDSIPAGEPAAEPACAVQTSAHFHKVFLRAGDYCAELDTNADAHYDASGLGRIHRAGAPSAICLSLPCTATPKYTIDRSDAVSLAICPGVRQNGTWRFGTDAQYTVTNLRRTDATAEAALDCCIDGDCVHMVITVGETGVRIAVAGAGEVALMLPAFAFDGTHSPQITPAPASLTIDYRNWRCRYTTDGAIRDTGAIACNRSGHYRVFCASGRDVLGVKVEIGENSLAE